jgi:GNAT superfamily N-acetyltransferase
MSETDPSLTWNLSNASDPSAPGCDLVRQWLHEHNWAVNPAFMDKLQHPDHAARPLILLTHANREVVGGLLAETQLSWLRISIMSVHPEWRSKDIGAALLAEAEQQALSRGCKHVYVDTMDYQAPQFYLSHGFELVGSIPDWDSHGQSKMYFSKPLKAPAFSP